MTSGLRWRKSTYSDNQGGDCVEVAGLDGAWEDSRVVMVRDSKDADGPVLAFAPSAWRGLSTRIRSGALDLE
ncbi:DUF397 domain-containing protein [Actinomadura sp. KC345]|uniref:DUF397 domain-containing protein n=1 Tax=Actinomadura sp. KC345 TaxID=2530371 RepID=UPI001A9CCC00|nr:DUF397 domain-containing protein [Actinomadura sp. KC345]